MKKHLPYILGSTLMVASSIALASHYAFLPWSWKHQSAVYWNVANLPSAWQDTFGLALQQWKQVPYVDLSLYLGSGNDLSMSSTLDPGVIGEFFENTCWYDSSSLCDGSEIKFSSNHNFSHGSTISPGTYDARWLALHELGHSVGLAHPSDSAQVMYISIAPATKKRTLQSGDKAGFQILY